MSASSQTFTREQLTASKRASAHAADYVAEALRRWPDFEWRDYVEPSNDGRPDTRFVEARWTAEGVERGLRTDVPIAATGTDLADAREQIAYYAIYKDELRKVAAQ